jgi:hypothetical protein
VQPWLKLSEDDRAFIRDNRAALKDLVSSGYTPAARTPEPEARTPDILIRAPEPLPLVGRHQLTEEDVQAVLRDEGDEVLADYVAGRLSRPDAIARAVRWHRQFQQTGGRYE